MISPAVFAAITANVLICVLLPVLLLLLLCRYQKKHGRPFGGVLISAGVGAAVFFVFQICLRIPLIQLLGGTIFDLLQNNIWLYSLFLGLTAGIFEELGRFAGFHTIKKQRSWESGVAFGVGHGGIEAILLVGVSNLNNLLLAVMIQNDTIHLLGLDAATVSELIAAYTSASPLEFLLGGIERIFAMTIQIALTLLVLLAVRKKCISLLLLSILLHCLVDSPLGIMQFYGWSALQIEGCIALLAAASVWFIFFSRRFFKEDTILV